MAADTFRFSKSAKHLNSVLIIIPMVLLFIGVYGGLMQTLFRAGIIQSDPFMGGDYYKGLTIHGVLNAIVFTTFFAVALGNALIPYALKKHLNTKIAWTSGILMLVGSVMAGIVMLMGEATVLYTFYPPLKANPAFYIGLTLLVVGSWIAFFNWIPMYLNWRKENSGKKTPMAVVGMFTTFIVWFIATISVAIEILFMLLPWSLGLIDEVNVMLARTLFWFFGHPLVYFWLLPAYVMYYVFMPKLAGGKLYSDMAGRLVFMMFVLFSIPVGTHHQYMDPAIGAQWKFLHGIFTFAVALPSLITAFTLAASLEHAGRKRGGTGLFGWMKTLPYFDKEKWFFSYLIAGLIIFAFGGISGIVNASYQMNTVVHNTAWIPGHFHLTVAGPVLLAFLGGSMYLIQQFMNKKVKMKGWTLSVPYIYTIGVFIFSWGLMRGGILGMPRRTNTGATYANPESVLYQPEWMMYIDITVIGGVIMFIAIVIYIVAFFATVFSKSLATEEEAAVTFPISEPLHDEPALLLRNFKPYIIIALILIALSYAPVIYDVIQATYDGSAPYSPNSPVPLR
ncbi:cbb3-type cytochrome c oxidase subunit I [Rhodohalobacter mucosus]|uniref:Cytochrome C oxidase subunit I n=1 Tax=Rhodohalobacter mucosus TaxID=2079485 RepID=A0A316U2X8_9BACT|nr:cbb3-type cytochrome c oxidase subunit I [Rhodohalobacter mucosus]PWN07686.1 cytochrome C oxidase subunit I [Rhodohalobacter mucosus]